jgi:hypothetical protein
LYFIFIWFFFSDLNWLNFSFRCLIFVSLLRTVAGRYVAIRTHRQRPKSNPITLATKPSPSPLEFKLPASVDINFLESFHFTCFRTPTTVIIRVADKERSDHRFVSVITADSDAALRFSIMYDAVLCFIIFCCCWFWRAVAVCYLLFVVMYFRRLIDSSKKTSERPSPHDRFVLCPFGTNENLTYLIRSLATSKGLYLQTLQNGDIKADYEIKGDRIPRSAKYVL